MTPVQVVTISVNVILESTIRLYDVLSVKITKNAFRKYTYRITGNNINKLKASFTLIVIHLIWRTCNEQQKIIYTISMKIP